VSEGIFHIVSENVEEEHIPGYMEDVSVEEHGCEEGGKVLSIKYVGWDHREVCVEPICILVDCEIEGKEHVEQEGDEGHDVCYQEDSSYVRGSFGAVFVAYRKQRIFTSLPIS
jgi:hypothetical protein